MCFNTTSYVCSNVTVTRTAVMEQCRRLQDLTGLLATAPAALATIRAHLAALHETAATELAHRAAARVATHARTSRVAAGMASFVSGPAFAGSAGSSSAQVAASMDAFVEEELVGHTQPGMRALQASDQDGEEVAALRGVLAHLLADELPAVAAGNTLAMKLEAALRPLHLSLSATMRLVQPDGDAESVRACRARLSEAFVATAAALDGGVFGASTAGEDAVTTLLAYLARTHASPLALPVVQLQRGVVAARTKTESVRMQCVAGRGAGVVDGVVHGKRGNVPSPQHAWLSP